MTTPICDFVRRYADSEALRLHMPGHKGVPSLGVEALDITEIDGADSLYEAGGIIRESESNAGRLFGAATFYSTEGSSLCIRAMLYLTALYAKACGRRPRIAAGRNVHKAFLSAAALLDIDILWLYPPQSTAYLSCPIDAHTLESALLKTADKPTAVYLTSPDYLGNTAADLCSLAAVCHRQGILLLVDNAHGAYLKFLPQSRHPLDHGADVCCDSAHKTLPVLTGGAYLHIAPSAPPVFAQQAKRAMALFGSTSPSYLILQSLDRVNRSLEETYPARLAACIAQIQQLKERLVPRGFVFVGEEPLKLTIAAKPYGYTGRQLADRLALENILCEFADPDFLVLMLTPEIEEKSFRRLERALLSIPRRAEILEKPPAFSPPERLLSLREACFSNVENVSTAEAAGRILASAEVACPPAVPIVVGGERIDNDAVNVLRYYGVDVCPVVAR